MGIGFGIDGGGTRSRLALFEVEGIKTLYQGEGGPTNPHSLGMQAAIDNVVSLLQTGCAALGITLGQLACGCVASAGLGREGEQQAFRLALMEQLSCPLFITNDGEALLTGNLQSLSGYALIAGTGSLALGRDDAGRLVRAGGLGHMLGDEGAAVWLGWQAVNRTLKSIEGRDLETGMLPVLLQHFDLADASGFVDVFHQHFDKSKVAACAPLVLAAAKAQDALAVDIVQQAAQALFCLVNSVYKQLPMSPARLALAGGLMEGDNLLRQQLMGMLKSFLPQMHVQFAAPGDATRGACLLAAHLLQ